MGFLSWVRNLFVGARAPISVTSEDQSLATFQIAGVDLYSLNHSTSVVAPADDYSPAPHDGGISPAELFKLLGVPVESPIVGTRVSRGERLEGSVSSLATELDAKTWNMPIVGVQHDNEDGTPRGLWVLALARQEEVYLRRDPDNEYSRHAVRVFDCEDHCLGFLPESMVAGIASTLDGGGFARAFVDSVSMNNGYIKAWLRIIYRAKLSPRSEFRRLLDTKLKGLVDEWFWAKTSRLTAINEDGTLRQNLIAALTLNEQVQVCEINDSVLLTTKEGQPFACLSKSQTEMVRAGIRDGRQWSGIVSEVREKSNGKGLEPVVAILLLRSLATALDPNH